MGDVESMRVSEDRATIFFKSNPRFYDLEKSGLKCNTVRELNWSDKMLFDDAEPYIESICIINSKTGEKFYKALTNISEWSGIYIFSWHP